MILITGGTGYIGSHTVVELINTGKEVVIIDDLSNSEASVVDKIETITGTRPKFYEGSILDKALMERIFTENKIESVIHFAGFKAVGESVEKPLKYYNNNIIGTIVLLEAMQAHGCKRIVFSSSATVYGVDNQPPLVEEMKTSAINPYGWTKVMIEQILRDICVSDNDFCAVLLRYFNPVGAHPSGLIGENPRDIPNNLMPYIAKVAAGELEHINVFGNDYDTEDGTGVRDYIHVVDLALGHIKALEKTAGKTGTLTYNLGTGKGFSVLQLIKSYSKACGKELKYVIVPRRSGDLATCYANPEKAEKELNWKAEKTIDDMCKDSWNF
ncbi:MAG: UDP-glucose 4-epimerase GalE, partial [Clostridia bacterium]|nr:UDP-glucose 4-epimerase GalE [Clostridia bacterium]